MIATFSADAGEMASKLEESAACGRLEECRPLVLRLVAMGSELVESAGGISVDALRSSTNGVKAQPQDGLGQTIGSAD
jgi:hypothetical protein